MKLTFDKPSFYDLSVREWLVTNGLGGYASSTISGANTRRYHGLLVASLKPPTERTVIVSKIEETIADGRGVRFNLSSNQYRDAIYPEGHVWITGFERMPYPQTVFQGETFKMSKTVFMIHHSNTTVIEYQNHGSEDLQLELNPFYVYRDYHHLFQEQQKFDFYREERERNVSVIYPYYGSLPFYVQCPGSVFIPQKIWNNQLLYLKESERGLDDHEDICSIGTYKLTLKPSQKGHIMFTIEHNQLNQQWESVFEKEKNRLDELRKESFSFAPKNLSASETQFFQDLVVAGDQFIVQRSGDQGHSIIAGYHWFTDWGRDTMIAMRGLVIAQGHQDLAKNIIRTFLRHMKDGLIPNRFPDHGEVPEYNTIDASLWLFIVFHEYFARFNDKDFIRECLPRLEEVLTNYRDGTLFRIHMTDEGLISGGEGLFQLTWMDAKVGEYVVTPRHGCAVEINALWYNAICIYSDFQRVVNINNSDWSQLASEVRISFRSHFLNTQGYLNDVVIPGIAVDDSFRPNQIYALSLPYTMLSDIETKQVLDQITQKLLTPYGLRSLAMDHPDFVPVYEGDQWHRDRAYHQGTVWAFLIGEYLLAVLKTNKYSNQTKQEVLQRMEKLQEHFYTSDGIHCISEIFDGGVPQRGRGCIHQAWSVGMLLSVFDALKEEDTSLTGS